MLLAYWVKYIFNLMYWVKIVLFQCEKIAYCTLQLHQKHPNLRALAHVFHDEHDRYNPMFQQHKTTNKPLSIPVHFHADPPHKDPDTVLKTIIIIYVKCGTEEIGLNHIFE